MKLWTLQTSDFSLLSGTVDHNRSAYFHSERGIPEAYRQLFHALGTNQIIWCSTVRERTLSCKVEWGLDVPESSILQFIDTIVWNRILKIPSWPPISLRHQWEDEAINKFPDDPEAQAAYQKYQDEAFWNQTPPNGSWWSDLFVSKPAADKENVTALIPHPVRPEWVISCPSQKT